MQDTHPAQQPDCGTVPQGSASLEPLLPTPEKQALGPALAYALGLISAVIVLMLNKRDPEVRFHAFQSIFATSGLVVSAWLLGILFGAEYAILLNRMMILAWIGLCGFLGYRTYVGERVVLPVVGPMAARQAAETGVNH